MRTSPQRRPGRSGHHGAAIRLVVENVNHPGSIRNVEATSYQAMRRAVLNVLPATPPGLTVADLLDEVLPHLPPDLFPAGARAGWWLKTVQLDLEAKGIIARDKSRPLRLYRL